MVGRLYFLDYFALHQLWKCLTPCQAIILCLIISVFLPLAGGLQATHYYRAVLNSAPSNIYAAHGMGVALAERGALNDAREVFVIVQVSCQEVLACLRAGVLQMLIIPFIHVRKVQLQQLFVGLFSSLVSLKTKNLNK